MPDQALERAYELLPGWVAWLRPTFVLLLAALAFVAVYAVVELGHRRACAPREEREEHWTERARRLAHRPKIASVGGLLVVAVAIPLILGRDPVNLALRLRVLALLVLWFCVGLVFQYRYQRMSARRPVGFVRYVRGVLSIVVVVFLPLVFLMATLAFMPQVLSVPMLAVAYVVLCLLLIYSVQIGLWIARSVGLARRADARLQAVVDRAARAVGHPSCDAYVVVGLLPNAFAAPVPPQALLFYERFVDDSEDGEFGEDEIEAIAHHEFGHLLESRTTLFLRLLPLFGVALMALVFPLMHLVGPWIFSGVLVAYLLVIFGVTRLSKRLEARADAHAHRAGDERRYAQALEKLYRLSDTPAVIGRANKTHPELYDRLLEAGVEPSYARPDPPMRYIRAKIGAAVLAVAIMVGGFSLARYSVDPADQPELAIVLHAKPSGGLFMLAKRAAERESRPRDALVFLEACDEVDGYRRVDVAAYRAVLHHELGETEKARDACRSAEVRHEQWVERWPGLRAGVDRWLEWMQSRTGLEYR